MSTFILPQRPSALELTDVKDQYFAAAILTTFFDKLEKTVMSVLKKSSQIVIDPKSSQTKNDNITNITAINRKLFEENGLKLTNSKVSAKIHEERSTQQRHSFKPKIFEMSVDNGSLYICIKKYFDISEKFLEDLFDAKIDARTSTEYTALRGKLRDELGFETDEEFRSSLLRYKIFDPSKNSKTTSMRQFYDKLKGVFLNNKEDNPDNLSGFEYLACLDKDNRFEMRIKRTTPNWENLTQNLADLTNTKAQETFYNTFERQDWKVAISEELKKWLDKFRDFENTLRDLWRNQIPTQSVDVGSLYFHIRRFATETRIEMSSIKNDFGKIKLSEFDDNSPLFEKISKEASSMKLCYMHYDFKKVSDTVFSARRGNQDLSKKYVTVINELFFPQKYSPTNFFEMWYKEGRTLEDLYEIVKDTFTSEEASEESQNIFSGMAKYQLRGVCATEQELLECLETEESADKGFFGGTLQAAKAEHEIKQGIIDACSNEQIKRDLAKKLEVEKSRVYYDNLRNTLEQNASQENSQALKISAQKDTTTSSTSIQENNQATQYFNSVAETSSQQDNTNLNEFVEDLNMQNAASISLVQASGQPVRRRSFNRR